MKCPKCQYISFDSGDRCRNCGYEFSLSAEAVAADAPPRDLPIKNDTDIDGPLGDFSLNTPSLPLFKPAETPDAPLVTPRAAPRAPLAVRRPAPVAPRPKAKKESVAAEPLLDLEAAPEPPAASGFFSEQDAPVPASEPAVPAAEHALIAASVLSRVAGGLIDFVLIGAIDVLVIYFTLRICDLTFGDVTTLPVAPLMSFFLLLNGGYLAAFVAGGGQTIGKMAAGTRVIPAADANPHGRVSFGQAVVRAGGYFVSALPAGLGFVPALAGERRALHDRLADTRVVKA